MQSGGKPGLWPLPSRSPGFGIPVVLVQARVAYWLFLFAKFPVIKLSSIVEFILLGPNLPPLFRTELGERGSRL